MAVIKGHIDVILPGLSSSIQDQGRFGYASEGVPSSGAMDIVSYQWANLLLGNSLDSAVIEWCTIPPKIKFSEAVSISLTGAIIEAFVDEKQVSLYKAINVPKGARLSFKNLKEGVYGYIAVSGGILTSKVLGSRSWFSGITLNIRLTKKMKFPYETSSIIKNKVYSHIKAPMLTKVSKIKVFVGPEFDLLSASEKQLLLDTEFSVSSVRNSMGIRLKEPFLKHEHSMLSSPVLPGTVQWTPLGTLIVLMRDAQTIGGYPRLFQLSETAINQLAQMDAIARFHFTL